METQMISAGELREAGFEIDESIPDVAVVPRYALKFGKVQNIEVSQGGDCASMDILFTVACPFKWYSIDVTPDTDINDTAKET